MARTSKPKSKTAATLIRKIKDRQAKAGVIGLGYVGLPLSMVLVEGGFSVTGFDISPAKVKLLNAGKSDIDDVPGCGCPQGG